MKKVISLLIIILVIIQGIFFYSSNGYNETYTLEFEAKDVEKDFDLYILLPKEYIIFAIEKDNLNLEYMGAITLMENDIPSISINKENISDKLYIDNGTEYVQILLEQNEDGKYEFDILSDYEQMDMKFRIKNVDKDYIAHIDNFKIDNGTCKVEYNYEKDIVKQPTNSFVNFLVKLLIFLLCAVIIVGIIAYVKQRR